MHYVRNDNGETTHDRRNRTTKSRKIRTLRGKETFKYLGILEAETIKQKDLREKLKTVSRENEKATRDKTK